MSVFRFISLSVAGAFGLMSHMTTAQTHPATYTTPAALEDLYRVPAHKTPSGLPVPRYVSLKFNQVNGRKGPSLDYPVAWRYQRRGLPLIIVAETQMWRKVRDVSGDESWIRKPALSGVRTVFSLTDVTLYSKPRTESRAVFVVEKEAILRMESCRDDGWCQFKTATGKKGWAPATGFWGARPL